MGRHSAPDDDADDGTAVAVLADDAGAARGRHADAAATAAAAETAVFPAVRAEAETTQIDAIIDPVVDQPVPEADTQQLPKVPEAASAGPAATPEPDGDLWPVLAETAAPTTPLAEEDDDDIPTGELARVRADAAAGAPAIEPVPTPGGSPAATSSPDRQPSGARGSAADLALLRLNRGVFGLVAAAVVVPFALYSVVLLALDKMTARTYLIWIWIPLVTAGVLVGVVLDIAHRRAATAPAARP